MNSPVVAKSTNRTPIRIAVLAAGLGVLGCFAAAFTFLEESDPQAAGSQSRTGADAEPAGR